MHIKLQGLKFDFFVSKYPNDYELMRNKTNIVCEKKKKKKTPKILVQSNGNKYLANNMSLHMELSGFSSVI